MPSTYVTTVQNLINQIQGLLVTNTSPLQNMGFQLWGGLALVAFLLRALDFVAEGGEIPNVMFKILRTVFFLSFTLFLLKGGAAGETPLVGFVQSFILDATALVLGGAAGGGLGGVLAAA